MNERSLLNGMIIIAAVVRLPDVGYILATDVKKEAEGIPNATVFTWKARVFNPGNRNYSAHSICIVSIPELGIVRCFRAGILCNYHQKWYCVW